KRGVPLLWPAIIAALIAVIGVGAYFIFSPGEPGTIQFTTNPSDAVVHFDGQPVSATSSPFVIPNVSPNTNHLIEVQKTGFRAWSTQVTLRPGESLQLADIVLAPEQAA